MDNTTEVPVKKKRGRKPKNKSTTEEVPTEPVVPKKRGRKPKGGKLITRIVDNNESPIEITNIILHLKCSLKDILKPHFSNTSISYNPDIPPQIQNFENANNQNYSFYNNNNNDNNNNNNNNNDNNDDNTNENIVITDDDKDKEIDNTKLLNQKLKIIKMQLYKKNVNKKSACFWCTYDFDNTACYIPIQENVNDISGYGSFCRPECAAAYLLKENIDDSTKFERYHLLNKTYGSVYKYKKSIKPAPNPYYLLDKFYGNLDILLVFVQYS